MSQEAILAPLMEELALWAAKGRIAEFWLRDDDAVEALPALGQLLSVVRCYGVPVTLAVIPQFTGETLAARLEREVDVQVAVHGWSHANHAAAGAKKQELSAERPTSQVMTELATGRKKLEALHGPRLLPMLVPPWNRIAPHLLPLLPGIGFDSLSSFGRAGAAPEGLRLFNTHIDVMDWHGSRGGRQAGDLIAEIVTELAERRISGRDEPIGLLTHHLVHDDAVWDFLERLFAATAGHEALAWRSAAWLLHREKV